MKSVLIICYSFPPYPGIGGRRWAKFAKYLTQRGNDVTVISQLNKSSKISEWTHDVKFENIRKIPLDAFYPEVFNSYPESFIKKLEYRFWVLFFRIFSSGMLYDRSFFWKKVVKKEVRQILNNNNINNLIVTGPPFRYMYFAAELKKMNPNLNFILDFRDPWTDNSTFMGIDSLSKRRLDNEKEFEKKAIQMADIVISANAYYTDILKKKYSDIDFKFHTLANGIDTEDYVNIKIENKAHDEVIYTLAGSLYNGTEYVIVPLLKYLKDLKANNEVVYKKLKFQFYGGVDKQIEKLISDSELEALELKGSVSKSVVLREIVNSDYCLMFTAPNHADNFNTKFYEYIALRKPIIHFSNDGAISEFLVKNQLGIPVRPNSFEDDMNAVIHTLAFKYNQNFDISPFDIKHITTELEQFLK